MWRLKLAAFCGLLNLKPNDYHQGLKQWFGPNWVFVLRPLIDSIKVAEFHPEPESRASLRAVWLVAVKERERRIGARKERPRHRNAEAGGAQRNRWSRIERMLKED